MATSREITNNAVGFKHLGPGSMSGAFNQQPAQNIVTKKYDTGHCGAHVVLQAHTGADATIMSVGECGLSGVVCADCQLLVEAEEEPGLHGQG